MHELIYPLEVDLGRVTEWGDEDDLDVLYPKFCKAVEKKANQFKRAAGYRRLCCVPIFVLAIAMVGRVQRHYVHATWFNVRRLGSMLGEYGGVSDSDMIMGTS